MTNRIRELRNAAGWSIAELASRSGVSRPLLNQWELGTRVPNLRRIDKVAEALGVTRAELLQEPAAGFGECTLVPWQPPSASERRNHPPGPSPSDLAPNARTPAGFLAQGAGAPAFGIMRDALLVIDLAAAAGVGDVAIVQLVNEAAATARTVIGRLLGDWLVGPNFCTDPTDRLHLPDHRHNIAGPVVAVWNQPPPPAPARKPPCTS